MLKICEDSIYQLNKVFSDGKKFCIVTHTSPDGDAIGSTVALREFLRTSGAEARIVVPDAYPFFLRELDPDDEIVVFNGNETAAVSIIREADVICALDINSFSRTDKMKEHLYGAEAFKVLIDHHPGPGTDEFGLIFSETEVSSTCELLYYILMEMPETGGEATRLPKASADGLFTGMTTDTNNFANSTYPSTLRMAASLIDAGVDRDRLLDTLYHQFSESRLRLIGKLLKDCMHTVDGWFTYMLLTKEMQHEFGYKKGDVEGVVNRPLEIGEVGISALFTEDDDFVRVSIRSKGAIAVNSLARKYFNGGGHINASGGRIFMDIKDIPDYYIKSVREYFPQGTTFAR